MTKTLADDAPRSAAFRPELEGLRAVAATLVAVFHIWMHRVSGGVDVFFVVASFLITTGLVGQIERQGRIDLAAVWGRLVKRLVPAAFLVLCVVVLLSLLILPKSRWKETLLEVAASAVYLENWLLAHNSVDYLAQHETASPVQHFWALSVQGQFYLLWPLLVLLAATLALRLRSDFRAVLLVVIGCVFACSLAFSVYITAHNQPFAYFHTAARVWEFCIGGALALLLPRLVLSRPLRVVAGWVGLLAILSCGVVLQVSQVFPGYAALWPTLGAVLVIAAGTSRSPVGVDRILASGPMVFIGGISYSIYLWHFPLLAFARLVAEPGEITFLMGVAVLACSFVLAYATNRLVENPLRRSNFGKHAAAGSFAVGAVCAVPVAVALLGWHFAYVRAQLQDRPRSVLGDPDYPGAAALARPASPGLRDVAVYPGPLAVSEDRSHPLGRACNQRDTETVPLPCTLGDPAGKVTIAVVGGSHAAQWLPALEDAALQSGWRIVSFTKSNCPFHAGAIDVGEKELSSCGEWNANVLRLLAELQPDAVFTTATRFDDGHEVLPDSYAQVWHSISAAGIRVIAVRDNPDFGFDASACVEVHGRDSSQCSVPRARIYGDPGPLRAMQGITDVSFIDLSDYFCGPRVCAPVVGNVMVYRHMNHLTATYVHTLTPVLKRQLQASLDSARGAH